MIALFLVACGSPPAEPAPAPVPAVPPAPTVEDLAFQRADRLLDQAEQRLQSRMVQSMSRHPENAEEACSIEEEALTTAAPSAEVGAQVGRASLRLRNPANAGPDWVRAWLDSVGEKPATPPIGFRRIDDTPQGKVARVVRPIVMQPHCIVCHGPPDTLAADVRATLHQQYPDDRATGYAVGDLRGATWAEIPVGAPAGG